MGRRRGKTIRIIPARAGFTILQASRPRHCEDHPRSRGVYAHTAFLQSRRPGSSPLARGLHSVCERDSLPPRIIPARAGFTRLELGERGEITDHPRSRGVYPLPDSRRGAVMGSSPLARGLLAYNEAEKRERGIIPARAGFTDEEWQICWSARDHPRSRGVYPQPLSCRGAQDGSSPLARGLRPVPFRYDGVPGIIPARAGFTRRTRSEARPEQDHPRSRGVYRRTAR